MILISILIALLLDHLFGHHQELRRFNFIMDFADQVRGWGGMLDGTFGVLLALLPAVGITGLVQGWLHGGLLALFGELFAIVVLLYCLGPRDLGGDVDGYEEAVADGDAAATSEYLGHFTTAEVPDTDEARHRVVMEGVLTQANCRLFAVVFWFAILGPMGAMLYRGSQVLQAQTGATEGDEPARGFNAGAARLHAVLAWLPAHLLAGTYALSGHFEAALHGWREGSHDREARYADPSDGVLVDVGRGSLGLDPEQPVDSNALHSAMALVWRSLVVWLVLVALLTMAGWAA